MTSTRTGRGQKFGNYVAVIGYCKCDFSIEKLLESMNTIKLYALPDREPWTLDRFLEEIKRTCRYLMATANNCPAEQFPGPVLLYLKRQLIWSSGLIIRVFGCRSSACDLHRTSQMVEGAVEDLIFLAIQSLNMQGLAIFTT